jgi:general secretion pathway protein G
LRNRYLDNQKGLTFIELMVVLFILALFSTLVVQTIGPKVKKAETETARHQMQILAVALDTYRLDVGEYPASLEDLVRSSATKWNGPYLRPERVPKDPWGDAYVYQALDGGEKFELYSTGRGQGEVRFGGEN